MDSPTSSQHLNKSNTSWATFSVIVFHLHEVLALQSSHVFFTVLTFLNVCKHSVKKYQLSSRIQFGVTKTLVPGNRKPQFCNVYSDKPISKVLGKSFLKMSKVQGHNLENGMRSKMTADEKRQALIGSCLSQLRSI